MTQSSLMENQDQGESLFKSELQKTTIYILLLSVIMLGMVTFNYMVSDSFLDNASPLIFVLMLLLLPTVDSIFIRLGNAIAGHKFYIAWLIYPLTNLAILIGSFTYLYTKYTNVFTFKNVGFFLTCLFVSMVFINSALTVRRVDPKHFEYSLKRNFDTKIVYMNKRVCLVYRICFGTLTFLSMFLLYSIFN